MKNSNVTNLFPTKDKKLEQQVLKVLYNAFVEIAEEKEFYVSTFEEFKDFKMKQDFIDKVPNDSIFVIKEQQELQILHDDWKTSCRIINQTRICITHPSYKNVTMCRCCPNLSVEFDWGKGLTISLALDDLEIMTPDEYEEFSRSGISQHKTIQQKEVNMKKKYTITFAMGIWSTQQEVIAESEDEAFKKAWKMTNDEDLKGGDIEFEEDDVYMEEEPEELPSE